jgi:hypothetical protein
LAIGLHGWVPSYRLASNVAAKGFMPAYLREPRFRFFKRVWRIFAFLRLGLLMMNVPLPMYSDLYNLSSLTSAKCETPFDF